VGRVVIGMDPHKRSATIEIIDGRETVLAGGRFGTDRDGYRAMLALYVELQSQICDFYGCWWVKMASGYGHVSYTCNGGYYEFIRSSRLPSTIIRCNPV
jgi:hypothetical protein